MTSIFKLGHMHDFIRRAVEHNRLHNPDDPVHAHLMADSEPAAAAARDASALERADAARKALVALHREFPAGAPVPEQAAYLLRGFAGLQPFAQASDLAAWDLVAETLEHHGFDLLAESEDGRALCTALWSRLQEAHPDGFSRKDLLARDGTLEWLADWFRTRIVATGQRADVPE